MQRVILFSDKSHCVSLSVVMSELLFFPAGDKLADFTVSPALTHTQNRNLQVKLINMRFYFFAAKPQEFLEVHCIHQRALSRKYEFRMSSLQEKIGDLRDLDLIMMRFHSSESQMAQFMAFMVLSLRQRYDELKGLMGDSNNPVQQLDNYPAL